MDAVFFKEFLMISTLPTIIFLGVLAVLFVGMFQLTKKKISFAKRVIVASIAGLALGFIIQLVANFPSDPTSVTFINETTTWYGLFGYGFMGLIKMLVIPLVMITIIHVIINMEHGMNVSKLVRTTLIVTMSMVAIAATLGLIMGVIFNVGGSSAAVVGDAAPREVMSIVATLLALIPSNPMAAMVNLNIIGLVIFSMFFGIGAKRMSIKYMDIVKPFFDLINALYKIVVSITISIIKFMPYAVIPLIAITISTNGLESIIEVGKYIAVLYLTIAIMFVIQTVALVVNGVSPVPYLKKSVSVFLMAFTSRSSVGTLPLTIETLTKKLGVSEGTASFVSSFGTTAGMQGCAGVFPALTLIFVANMTGVEINLSFIILSLIVITIGSLGIAGIPGTATIAASVALSGTGMIASFPIVSPILAIDPLIDMPRTMLNVSGAMVNSIIVDKHLGLTDKELYKNLDLVDEEAMI